ncbi:MAG: ABC transporter ATP-binding protein [Janthinobacterium lividum]
MTSISTTAVPAGADAAASADPLLRIRNLSVPLPGNGERPFAVRDISFDLHRGEILCIVGESGSGKSISANAIMGLLPDHLKPSGGRILFNGVDLLEASEEALLALRGKRIGMIFQEPMSALNPTMKVGRQIAEVMQTHDAYPGVARNRRVLELLAFVGLPDPATLQDVYPFRLSGGQRQRVMIAMALALEPDILIADEPTTALDVTTQAQILKLIRDIQRSMGMGVMFITHDFGVVSDIADRIIVMEKGVLVEQGAAARILDAPQHAYTRRLIAAVPHGHAMRPGVVSAPTPAPLLDVRNLTKTYITSGGAFVAKRVVHAVNDVSFSVQRGETLGIVGESGSGKSSIGKCLLKLQDVDGGQILFDGQDIAPLSQAAFRPQRHRLQMIFQDPFASLNPRQTVRRILTDGPVANGVARSEADARARGLLGLVEMEASSFDRYPGEFSGGQRQRLGIARALALQPELLVADESVSALDVSVQAQVLALLQDLQKRLGVAMVFITHDLRVAAQICHRIAVMHKGRLVEYGPAAEVLNAPRDPYTQRLIQAMPGREWDARRLAE